ncbi:Alpha/Beta hydrolase protein [Sphaerosporella brunnea]|uniref:Alpha/Beta hydrolase protein n=1 Tax=Sphaerosporella brunnea TaxID=1250544 RepID=A0A5J5F2F5_9PEZI|nr:Alpha/Beta hydrolase protein [Sphaerosporella brunnea]
MVSARRLVSVGLLMTAAGVTARPMPEPFDIGGLWDDIKGGVNNLVDKTKNALFPSTISGTLSPRLLPDFTYFAEFSAAAYCDSNYAVNTEVGCSKNICPTVSKNSVKTIVEFSEGFADTTGLIARDDTTKTIVLAFRGSHSVRNWLTNLAASMVRLSWCSGCKIHEGFYSAYQDEADVIIPALTALRKQYPSYKVVATGHSLGGALAQIAATDLRMRGFEVTTYTYGSPRIGNENLCKFMSDAGTNYRVTHTDDPVPRLPLMLMGYQHVSPEYHIKTDGIGAAGIDVLKGYINFGGNTADDGLISVDILAHLHYLITAGIADCAGTEFEIRKMLE